MVNAFTDDGARGSASLSRRGGRQEYAEEEYGDTVPITRADRDVTSSTFSVAGSEQSSSDDHSGKSHLSIGSAGVKKRGRPRGSGKLRTSAQVSAGVVVGRMDSCSMDGDSHSSMSTAGSSDSDEEVGDDYPKKRSALSGGAHVATGVDIKPKPIRATTPKSGGASTETGEVGKKKKGTGPMECSMAGCTKKSRGSSGLCRSHGGGEKCVVANCQGFARLDGRCCMHGGAQMCSVEGCQRRARFYGRCTMHGGYVNCKEEGCTLRAVGKGRCAKHGGKDHCKHPGCCRHRLKSRNDWCYTHHMHLERYREMISVERSQSGYTVQCGYFEVNSAQQCTETAVAKYGLCPEHLLYSLCGESANCQKRAQVQGRCLEHARSEECLQEECVRPVDAEGAGFCREHKDWMYSCSTQGCKNRALMPYSHCPPHMGVSPRDMSAVVGQVPSPLIPAARSKAAGGRRRKDSVSSLEGKTTDGTTTSQESGSSGSPSKRNIMTLQCLLEAAKETNKEMGETASYSDTVGDGIEESSNMTPVTPSYPHSQLMIPGHGGLVMPHPQTTTLPTEVSMLPGTTTSNGLPTSAYYHPMMGPTANPMHQHQHPHAPSMDNGGYGAPRRPSGPEELMLSSFSEAHRRQYAAQALSMVPTMGFGMPMRPHPHTLATTVQPHRYYPSYNLPAAAWQWEGAYQAPPPSHQGGQETYGSY